MGGGFATGWFWFHIDFTLPGCLAMMSPSLLAYGQAVGGIGGGKIGWNVPSLRSRQGAETAQDVIQFPCIVVRKQNR